jgi:hypothetical protein
LHLDAQKPEKKMRKKPTQKKVNLYVIKINIKVKAKIKIKGKKETHEISSCKYVKQQQQRKIHKTNK